MPAFPGSPYVAPPSTRGSSVVVAVVVGAGLLLVVAVVAAVLVLGPTDRARSSATRLTALDPENVVLLDGEPSQPAEALVTERNYGESPGSQRVVRIRFDGSSDDDAVIWRSDPLQGSLDDVFVRVSGNVVYLGTGDTVRALSLATGATIWTDTLTDRLDRPCEDCFQLVDDGLVVRSYDGMVTRFGPDSPDPMWSHRLETTNATMVVADGQVVVLDTPDGGTGTEAQALDPTTGRITGRTKLSCPDPDGATFNGRDQMLVVPGTGDLLAVFGSSTACAVRFDPATGTPAWSADLSDGFDGYEGDAVLVDAQYLVADLASGPTSVDLETGTVTPLVELEDLEVAPVRIVDRTLIAETGTRRGTTRTGLAAFDLRSGASLWTSITGVDQSDLEPIVDPRRPTTDYGERPTQRLLVTGAGDDLSLVTLSDGRSGTVNVRPLDGSSGELGAPSGRSFVEDRAPGGSDVELLAVRDRSLLLEVGPSVRLIPLPDGEIGVWPGE